MRYVSLITLVTALLWAQQHSPSWGRAYVDSAASVVPLYIAASGASGGNNRVPYVAYLTIRELQPNTTYRYVVRMDDNTNPANSLSLNAGAGNAIYYSNGTFTRVTRPNFNDPTTVGTLQSDNIGTARLVFILEPTSNARFAPEKTLYPKVFLLEDASRPTDSAVVYADKTPVRPLAIRRPAECNRPEDCGSFLYDTITPSLVNSRFVFLYDEYLLGPNPRFKRPLVGTLIEPTGISYPDQYLGAYQSNVANKRGWWGNIIPNVLPNGVRSIIYHEQGHLASPNLADVGIFDRDGNWPSGYNTANPENGADAAPAGPLQSLTQPLRPVSDIRQPDAFERGAFIWRNLSQNPLCNPCDGFIAVTSNRVLSSPPLCPSFEYDEDCAYHTTSGSLPEPPLDSTLLPFSQWWWIRIGGPGWQGQFGDSVVVPVYLRSNPFSHELQAPAKSSLGECVECPVECSSLFDPTRIWRFKLHPVAFSNEAGNLVLNYKYRSQMGTAASPFYQESATGAFLARGTPSGLTETSGANLSAVDLTVTSRLIIGATLPYETRIYPAFPFGYNGATSGSLEWKLIELSSGNTLQTGFSPCNIFLVPPTFGCTCTAEVDISNLDLGNYRLLGLIIPPQCPRDFSPDPIPLDPIEFTVSRTSSMQEKATAPSLTIYTRPDHWIVQGVQGEVLLYNLQGQRVWSVVSEHGQVAIPRQGLQAGIYLLVVQTPTGPTTRRLAHLSE